MPLGSYSWGKEGEVRNMHIFLNAEAMETSVCLSCFVLLAGGKRERKESWQKKYMLYLICSIMILAYTKVKSAIHVNLLRTDV